MITKLQTKLQILKDACDVNLIGLMGDPIIGYKFVVRESCLTQNNADLAKTANHMLEEISNEMDNQEFVNWCSENVSMKFDESLWNKFN